MNVPARGVASARHKRVVGPGLDDDDRRVPAAQARPRGLSATDEDVGRENAEEASGANATTVASNTGNFLPSACSVVPGARATIRHFTASARSPTRSSRSPPAARFAFARGAYPRRFVSGPLARQPSANSSIASRRTATISATLWPRTARNRNRSDRAQVEMAGAHGNRTHLSGCSPDTTDLKSAGATRHPSTPGDGDLSEDGICVNRGGAGDLASNLVASRACDTCTR